MDDGGIEPPQSAVLWEPPSEPPLEAPLQNLLPKPPIRTSSVPKVEHIANACCTTKEGNWMESLAI